MLPDDLYNEPGLLLRIADGDERAFALLFNYYYPLLRPFVWKFTRSEADTEEVLQEIFMKVWLTRNTLPEIENLQGWIYKITSRQCLTLLRSHLHRRKKISGLGEQPTGTVPTPADMAGTADIARHVHEAIEQLPPQRRQIYRLSREAGLTPAEIAAQLSLSVQTVKNALVSALKQIREYLEAAGHILPAMYLFFYFHK